MARVRPYIDYTTTTTKSPRAINTVYAIDKARADHQLVYQRLPTLPHFYAHTYKWILAVVSFLLLNFREYPRTIRERHTRSTISHCLIKTSISASLLFIIIAIILYYSHPHIFPRNFKRSLLRNVHSIVNIYIFVILAHVRGILFAL